MARIVPDDAAGHVIAIDALRAGHVVALPTDTVYGIAVAIETPKGIEALFAAKGRPPDKAISLLLADVAQAHALAEMTPAADVLAAAFWPGGVTLVVPRRRDAAVPALRLAGDPAGDPPGGGPPTVGIRIPDHPTPRALAMAVGPLPTTSANASGQQELRDASEIEAELGDSVAVIIDGARAQGGPASTVVDVTGDRPRVLRAGAVPEAEIERVLAHAGLAEPGVPGVGR